jgi:hypothetical protein
VVGTHNRRKVLQYDDARQPGIGEPRRAIKWAAEFLNKELGPGQEFSEAWELVRARRAAEHGLAISEFGILISSKRKNVCTHYQENSLNHLSETHSCTKLGRPFHLHTDMPPL